jgi:hypothetical protein
LKALIGTQVESAPKEALALSKEHLRDEDGEFDFPSGLQGAAIDEGWETTFQYFKDSWKADNSGSRWFQVGEFPSDFNFSSFAEAWAQNETEIELGEEGGFYAPPKVIWKEWSQADPQAAYQFLEEIGSVSFGFEDFFDGYQKSARSQDIFAFSQELLSSESDYKENLGVELGDYLEENENYTRDFLAWQLKTGDFALSRASLKNLGFYRSQEEELGRRILESFPDGQRLEQIRRAHLIRRIQFRARGGCGCCRFRWLNAAPSGPSVPSRRGGKRRRRDWFAGERSPESAVGRF